MASVRQSFYVTEKIGPKQSFTPEGFLLCEEVAVARTGMMLYGPDETPIEAGPDGVVKIMREEEDVFSPLTIASAQAKSVVNDHPEEDVVPANWKDLTCGVMVNPRRGEKALDDLLLADLLITTPEGIKAVQSGKVEVSLGYDADYDEVSPGVGKQSNIIINHVALVEQGRCGPRCAIRDRKLNLKKEPAVANKVLDALMKAFKAKDAEEVKKIAEEVKDDMGGGGPDENGETHIHIHANGDQVADPATSKQPGDFQTQDDEPNLAAHIEQNAAEHAEMMERISALEAALAGGQGAATGDSEEEKEKAELEKAIGDEVPEELKEKAAKAQDSAYLGDSFQDTVAMAEILVPGIRVPTYDRAAKPGQTFKKICGLRRQALDLAYMQPATRAMLDDLLGGKTLDTKSMTCDAAKVLFKSAASAQRTANNASKKVADHSAKPAGVMTLADLNKKNRERFPN